MASPSAAKPRIRPSSSHTQTSCSWTTAPNEHLILVRCVQRGQKRQLAEGAAKQCCDRRRVSGRRTSNHALDPKEQRQEEVVVVVRAAYVRPSGHSACSTRLSALDAKNVRLPHCPIRAGQCGSHPRIC